MKYSVITASYLIIGDEILSGRTKDENLNFLAKELTGMGITLKEVRVVRDEEEDIIHGVNTLRKKYDYLFTTGGIGPTHDDITSLSIAKAFEDKLVMNKEAHKILIDYYGDDINEARLKMAYIPLGAKLLNNPVSSAPGFIIKNVVVMAGVPKIMQEMFRAAKKDLSFGDKMISREIKIITSESKIAKELSDLQKKYEEVIIGSYPSKAYICIVFRCHDKNYLNSCLKEFTSILENKKINYDL